MTLSMRAAAAVGGGGGGRRRWATAAVGDDGGRWRWATAVSGTSFVGLYTTYHSAMAVWVLLPSMVAFVGK